MDELTAHSVGAEQIFVELLAHTGLVLFGQISLDHELVEAMCEGTLKLPLVGRLNLQYHRTDRIQSAPSTYRSLSGTSEGTVSGELPW